MSEYKCEYCDREFKRAQNLKWHRTFKHQNGKMEKKPAEPKPEKKKEKVQSKSDDVCSCGGDLQILHDFGNGKYSVQCVNCGKKYVYTEED